MLAQLRIENLATISEMEIEFKNGFSILTGETGAGKSIMIDAILIVLGHRNDPDMIRSGQENAIVEAIFTLPKKNQKKQFELIKILENADINSHDELIVRCLVSRKGRQKRIVNGVPVTMDFLKRIGQQLINIHGQHDNQSLLRVSSHIDFLDRYGKLMHLRQEVSERYQSLKLEQEKLKKFKLKFENLSIREKELKGIIFDLEELNIKNGEENDLRIEEQKLTHVEKLSEILNTSNFILQEKDTSVIEQLEILKKLLSDSKKIDPDCNKILEGVESIIFQSKDIHHELLKYISKLEENPTRLLLINERLSKIQHFVRKFHLNNSEELNKLLENSRKELESLGNIVENEKEILERINFVKKQLKKSSELLSIKRQQISKSMDLNIISELQKLGMKKARFKTQIDSFSINDGVDDEGYFSPNGIDEVKFLMSVNPGQELKILSKIASGGELSRIMLAIKTVITSLDTIEILIFDEIDTGISGAIAEIVGQKLYALGKRHQTLCVTHLAQIAAFANHHFLVSKSQKDNETFTTINYLEKKSDRVRALANLIGGTQITDQTLDLANEMLSNFQS